MTEGNRASPDEIVPAGMREHPDRRKVVGEMHLRRWPEIPVPGFVVQWLRLASDAAKNAQRERLLALPQASRFDRASGPRHPQSRGRRAIQSPTWSGGG